MKPTSKRLLAVIAFVGAVCALSVARMVLAVGGHLMPVRAATPAAMAVMTGALLWWTVIVRRRLVHVARARHDAAAKPGSPAAFVMRERPLEPLVAARTVALAFAASRAGSYVAGWYTGVALSFAGHLDVDDVRWRLVYAVLTALIALALVVIAMWLERSCTLPPPRPGAEAAAA